MPTPPPRRTSSRLSVWEISQSIPQITETGLCALNRITSPERGTYVQSITLESNDNLNLNPIENNHIQPIHLNAHNNTASARFIDTPFIGNRNSWNSINLDLRNLRTQDRWITGYIGAIWEDRYPNLEETEVYPSNLFKILGLV